MSVKHHCKTINYHVGEQHGYGFVIHCLPSAFVEDKKCLSSLFRNTIV